MVVPKKQSTQASVPRKVFDYDKFFGNTMMSVAGEPVTPSKIAIFYLLKTLFHVHFGRKAVPSLKPFSREEKKRAFSMIYGLILSDSEMQYKDFRLVALLLDKDLGRNIYYHFTSTMELLARGDEQLDMLFENAFYTFKRPRHKKVQYLQRSEEESVFMLKNSFLYIWVKRVLIRYTASTENELFAIQERLRTWLVGGEETISKCAPPTLPFEIDCSVRARQWISDQLHLVQFAPTRAQSYSTILDWCHVIAKRHRDVYTAHLLKAVVHVQMQNPHSAIGSLKEFFDLSMLGLTDQSEYSLIASRLMQPCQVALRFGPILQGRVYRLFGDHETANFLFKEAIQQAQLNADEMVNRIANIELTTNGILTNGPLLERRYGETQRFSARISKNLKNANLGDRRVIQETHHAHANLIFDMSTPSIMQNITQSDFSESYEIHMFQIAITKFLLCLEDIMDGTYTRARRTPQYVTLGLHQMRHLYDPQNKTRMSEDYANSVMSSGLISNGMYHQAKRAAEGMMVSNCEAPCTPRLETESHAVNGVNLVYALAAIGDYPKALSTLRLLATQFPADRNWMAARHVAICSDIIHFEKDFLLHKYSECSNHIAGLQGSAPLEFALRKSLLLCATGKFKRGVEILKNFKSGDVRGNMRIQMQLATLHTAHRDFGPASTHLEAASKIAHAAHFLDASCLIARRSATLSMARGAPEHALKLLEVLDGKVEQFGTWVEQAVFYATHARCLRLLGKDPRQSLKLCKSLIIGNKWPAMEKLVLAELAELHGPLGMVPNEQRLTWTKERFVEIENEYGGACTWIYI